MHQHQHQHQHESFFTHVTCHQVKKTHRYNCRLYMSSHITTNVNYNFDKQFIRELIQSYQASEFEVEHTWVSIFKAI